MLDSLSPAEFTGSNSWSNPTLACLPKDLVLGLETPEWRILCKTRRSEACVKLTGRAPGSQLPWMQKSHSEWGAVQFQSRASNFLFMYDRVHAFAGAVACACAVCKNLRLKVRGQA